MDTNGGKTDSSEGLSGNALVYNKAEFIDLENPIERERFLNHRDFWSVYIMGLSDEEYNEEMSHIGTSIDDWLKEEFNWWDRFRIRMKAKYRCWKINKERKNGKGN